MTNLTMYSGNSRTVTESVGPTGLGAPGIAGWEFWLTVKWDPSDPDADAVLQKGPSAWTITTPGDGTANPPIAGVAFCNILPADTITLGAYQVELTFDVRAKDSLGNIFTIDYGTLTVVPSVTQATV